MDSSGNQRDLPVEAARKLLPGSLHRRAYVGPPAQYDFMGATQFRLLTALGLTEDHTVLDVGCGSLRAGRLLLPYLLPGRYFGVEPNRWLIDDAIREEIGADLVRLRAPSFSETAAFDLGTFGRRFDYIVAQSIFSHTGHDLTCKGLAAIREVMHERSIALVTFVEAGEHQPARDEAGWIYPGVVPYEPQAVSAFIAEARLFGQRLAWFHPRQTWYLLALSSEGLLSEAELAVLGTGAVLRDPRFAARG